MTASSGSIMVLMVLLIRFLSCSGGWVLKLARGVIAFSFALCLCGFVFTQQHRRTTVPVCDRRQTVSACRNRRYNGRSVPFLQQVWLMPDATSDARCGRPAA